MKVEVKPKVVGQVLGYRIKQMCDSKKLINKWGVYVGKNLVNESKGFDALEDALNLAKKLASGEVEKNVIKNK